MCLATALAVLISILIGEDEHFPPLLKKVCHKGQCRNVSGSME